MAAIRTEGTVRIAAIVLSGPGSAHTVIRRMVR